MFKIANNGIITITKGDTFRLPLFINMGNEFTPYRYELTENDKVYVGVMEPNKSFEQAIIKKMYTKNDLNENGDVEVKFESKDTYFLLPGTYYYEIKVEITYQGSNHINTIVPKTKFIILE